MAQPTISVEELIATLKNSNVPSLLVEGVEDIVVYRRLEEKFPIGKVAVIGCGGRDKLLSIFRRRAEFNNLKTTFFADRDLWVITGIPEAYEGIVFTRGYSFENDLLINGCLDRFLSHEERQIHNSIIDLLVQWFAREVEEFRAGRQPLLDRHIDRIVAKDNRTFHGDILVVRGDREPDEAVSKVVREKYRLSLRGKTYLQSYIRVLIRTRPKGNYNEYSLRDIAQSHTPEFLEEREAMVRKMLE